MTASAAQCITQYLSLGIRLIASYVDACFLKTKETFFIGADNIL